MSMLMAQICDPSSWDMQAEWSEGLNLAPWWLEDSPQLQWDPAPIKQEKERGCEGREEGRRGKGKEEGKRILIIVL